VTAAMFVMVPLASAATVAAIWNVTEPPTGMATVAETFPVPAAGHDAPAEAEHVHAPKVTPGGAVSVKVAPLTAAGPLLVTTIV
jgi:hypothetical protein